MSRREGCLDEQFKKGGATNPFFHFYCHHAIRPLVGPRQTWRLAVLRRRRIRSKDTTSPEQLAKNGESATNQPGGYFAASFLIVFIPRKVARSLRAFSKALLEKVDSLCFLRQSQ